MEDKRGNRKKIAVVTATRAEYGILKPLILRLRTEKSFLVHVLVTGTHLSQEYGNTKQEIQADNIEIFREIPILEKDNTPYDISVTMANAIRGFAEYFRDEKPELLVVLGDRTELLGVCCAAMNEQIPIAHLHGGELTEGAVDDSVRHAITKMSHLHFAASEIYRKRIIQMGEEPGRVFNVGALGVENILRVPLLTEDEIRHEIEIPKDMPYVMVTFHPVTLEQGMVEKQVLELLKAVACENHYFYLFTKANADAGGSLVNGLVEDFSQKNANVKLVSSLGMLRYLSAVKYCELVLGNSSSGVIEAPALGIPTVNIGDRQKGRLMADTVISCEPEAAAIIAAMQKAQESKHLVSHLYGDGTTSEKIVSVIKDYLENNKINLKKKFYDLERI